MAWSSVSADTYGGTSSPTCCTPSRRVVLFIYFIDQLVYHSGILKKAFTRHPIVASTRWTKNASKATACFGKHSTFVTAVPYLPTSADAGPPVDRSISFSLRQERLGYSAKPELLPLVRLSRDLPPFRARALLEAGYPTPVELAGADCARIAEVFMRCLPFRSAGWDASEVSLLDGVRGSQFGRLLASVEKLDWTQYTNFRCSYSFITLNRHPFTRVFDHSQRQCRYQCNCVPSVLGSWS